MVVSLLEFEITQHDDSSGTTFVRIDTEADIGYDSTNGFSPDILRRDSSYHKFQTKHCEEFCQGYYSFC